jgi:FAD/FMN-containing dehydrogenase
MVKKNKNLIKVYETDASGIRGHAAGVECPKTIGGVVKVVRMCGKVVPRGAGTGLVGGAVPQHGKDVVLDLSGLNMIEKLDKTRKTIEVEAGVILDELQGYLGRFGLEFPVNPSSHSVCTIGGMIATNAVGARAVKYGKTSNWVNWIEIVDCNGNIERKTRTELSDYAGMEGTTGVIVKAGLKLVKRKERTASLIGFGEADDLIEVVRELKRDSAVSMVEFIDRKISKLLGLDENYYLLVEYESDAGELRGEKYMEVLALRDSIYPKIAKEGYIRIEDPKILLDKFEKLLGWLESRGVPVFGHLGVGILHPCFKEEQEKLIPDMMHFVKRLGGQISGEHGVGLLKKEFVDPNDKKILINVKKRTDALGKFNEGKLI